MSKKNKALSVLLALILSLGTLAGCGGNTASSEAQTPAGQPESTSAAQPITPDAPPQTTEMSHEELVAAAKAEGKVVVYSTTSRISKAAELFTAAYGIEVETSNLKDYELIEKISTEGKTGTIAADFVICQDAGRTFGELMKPGYLYSYLPPSMVDVIPEQYQNPLVFCNINKVFIFNNEKGDEAPISNIWALTDPELNGRFQFKSPFGEGVNSNFCTMVVSDEWSAKIADAYKAHYGKEIELTTPNAGYEWLKAIFENDLVLGTSDTNIAENIGIKGQDVPGLGLFVYSKTRYDAEKDLSLKAIMDLEPFSGFYYPLYSLMCKDAKHPAAAQLFIEFLLTEEGFAPWGVDNGTYSSNPNIPVNEGDFPMETWESILVPENPEWCFANRAEVEEFLNNYIY